MIMSENILDKIRREQCRPDVPAFKVGDSVKVHVKIKEGDKERVQVFAGAVIARDGDGATETFTVRRVSFGEGVERIFPIHSPGLAKIEVERSSRTRRAKLYYLRQRSGKTARLKGEKVKEAAAGPAPAPEA
jgi:large subunit ribosomal protein L19